MNNPGLPYAISNNGHYPGLSTADYPPLVAVDIWPVWYRVPRHLRRKAGRMIRRGRLVKAGQLVSWGLSLNPAQVRGLKAAIVGVTAKG